MKYALIFCFFSIFCTSFQSKQTDTPKLSLNAFISGRDGNNMSVKVTLTNNTPDTVKYVTWSCSWQESYSIDNDKWRIYVNLCYNNGHTTILIPPYKSETKTLELERVIGYTKSQSLNLKIGFHFVPPPDQLKNIPIKLEKLKPNDLTIWSNTLSTNYFSKK
jgi:hypothetical protein